MNTETERDVLAIILHGEGSWCGECDFDGWATCADCRRSCRGIASAILAAGYRKTDPTTDLDAAQLSATASRVAAQLKR